MENLKKTSKVFLYFTVLFFTLWLGGYVARHLVIYQFFEPENLGLKEIYKIDSLDGSLYTILPLFILNIISFVFLLIFFISFLLSSKINLKYEGWLLIITLLIFLTAPFEIYLLIKDYEIVKDIYYHLANSDTIINLIRDRITLLSNFSLIEIFAYCGVIFLVVFKPLRKIQ